MLHTTLKYRLARRKSLALTLVTLLTASCGGGRSAQVELPYDSFLFVVTSFKAKSCSEGQCLAVPRSQLGSGFIAASGPRGSWGITAGHVCSDNHSGGSVSIRVFTQGGASYEVSQVKIIDSVDLCFVFLDGVYLPSIRMAKEKPLQGERVYSLAAPVGIFDVGMIPKFEGFYSGAQSRVTTALNLSGFPILDAYTIPARPGSSGSPIFNSSGELVGICIIARMEFENFALSVPFEAVKAAVNAVKKAAGERLR